FRGRPPRSRRPPARGLPRGRRRRRERERERRRERERVMHVLAFEPFGFQLPLPVIVLGVTTGLPYGLLAVGLVLVYRTNRIINFAHGAIGAFGAAILFTA